MAVQEEGGELLYTAQKVIRLSGHQLAGLNSPPCGRFLLRQPIPGLDPPEDSMDSAGSSRTSSYPLNNAKVFSCSVEKVGPGREDS